jgi:hypothetical protein
VPLLEAFNQSSVSGPMPPPSVYELQGFTPFLTARVCFLGKFERIYTTNSPMPMSERTITMQQNFFNEYKDLQDNHLQHLVSRKGGKALNLRETYWTFTLPAMVDKWGPYSSRDRWYNWHIPLASLNPGIHYAHSMMISHGILFTGAIWDWHGKAIIEDDPAVLHIEKTKDLCIKAIELYWELIQTIPILENAKGKWSREIGEKEMKQQETYVREHMGMCEIVTWDLERARKLLED